MATVTTVTPTTLRCSLKLPPHILQRYENEAKERGIDFEDLLSERLTACSTHTASKPLYLDDELRRELEDLLKINLSGPGKAVNEIKKALSIHVGKVQVELSPNLSYRLHTRAIGRTFAEYVRSITTLLLEQHVGLR